MTANETTSRSRRTDRWTPARLFHSTLAVAFGLLGAVILVVGLLYLLFGPGGRETLVELEAENVIVEDANDEQSAPMLELAMDDCPADACILPMPRRPRVA
jgi:hypothetical protein